MLMVCISVFTIKTEASDRWETLRAINWVENPTNHTRVGRYGELGPYQFRVATWRMHTTKPFSLATNRAVADEVAVKHYEWIRQALQRAGVDPNPYNIAMAWNCGVSAVVAGRVPDASYSYAERVSNLVETFKERTPVAEESPRQQPPPPSVLEFNPDVVRFRVPGDGPRFVLATS
jgi:hypothetical protein